MRHGWSRAFSRQQALDPRVLDANQLVGDMLDLMRRTLGQQIRVETVLASGLWRCFADAMKVENAVLNLAVNARDAMPEGGRLTIETGNVDLVHRHVSEHGDAKPGEYVVIGVTDTGTGMAPKVIERAFDPFYTTKGAGKGTGLGLVVEDEPSVRHMSVDALRELGYIVVQASDARQALNTLAIEPRVDVLFTDIVMPDVDGTQLVAAARQLRPGTSDHLYDRLYARRHHA